MKATLSIFFLATGIPTGVCEQSPLPGVASLCEESELKRIRTAIDVTHPYAAMIRKGIRIPHPRHWVPLAELAGVAGAGFN